MGFSKLYFYLLLINTSSLILVSAKNETRSALDSNSRNVVNVGLILDFNSSIGFLANVCISMAISDFYSKNPHYATRLALHPKNSKNVLTAASAAFELVNEEQVVAIIGPQYADEARFVAEFGVISQVPVISFSVKSSSLWPSRNPYFIQTTLPDDSQLEGITSLVQQLGWHDIVVLYQDDTDGESCTGFVPSITDAFQKASIKLTYVIPISSSANESHVWKELGNLWRMPTRVFLVHVTSLDLASRLFSLANEMGMMSKGTAWIITDALSNSLSALDATTIESMEGVLGIRPYIPESNNMEAFRIRWNTKKYLLMQQQPNYTENIRSGPDTDCLRAYDTVWAVATAVENIIFPQVEKLIASSATITSSRVSEAGPELVQALWKTEFLGLSGEFKLEHGQLETPVFEIINIVGKGDRTVGYWTPERGLSQKVVSAAEKDQAPVYSKPVDQVLKPIIWPGVSTDKPKGWDVPGMGIMLRVGVPDKPGFREFVNVQEIGDTKKYNVTGFVIEVFKAVLHALSSFNLEPEFIPFVIVNNSGGSNGTYDDLVNKLSGTETPEYEAVVGDITIRAHREKKVDFSLPYSESGVVMVVRAEPDKLKNIWIFLKPLSWDLWLAIVVAAIFVGIVLRILERRLNLQRQLGIILFPFAALAFPESNMVGNNWARFVLVVWLFLAYILMQSYTANLSSILTVGQLSLSADIPACAGYQDGSFVKDLLTKLRIKGTGYSSMEDFDKALSLGCKHGGVDAIYDEIPYIKLFLHKYGSKYKMVGSTYSTGGFGFAFPTGSPLSKPISEAILGVMENGKIQEIEKKYFGEGYASGYQSQDISRDSPSLTSYSFAGLFTITAILTFVALTCSECSVLISRYRNQHVANIPVVPPENDGQDSTDQDEILGQEEGDQQQIQEPTDTNIDHGSGPADDEVLHAPMHE
ncbi:Glutamate receptor [Heracleum sosnowskyi]|uniref:Glutamate receptor n=1 Tax=Heracleum sosnowskyi TaxID=360622 RepID=A0AAD8JCF3_9APIA|nr:Glutamate receptor [Heracleum sosnowskyi]